MKMMIKIDNTVTERNICMVYKFKKSLYPKIALLKSAYSFTDKAYIYLDEDDNYYIVDIESKGKIEVNLKDFENEMIFEAVRNEIYLRTNHIRNLTISRAMASTIIGSQEEFCDQPAQYNIESCSEEILKDWFESNE